MPNLTASIPHQLPRTEVKRRIEEELRKLRQQQILPVNLNETWQGDRMDFSAAAMGQTITGHATVDDAAVHVEVVLPWFLSMLAGRLQQRIEQRGGQLLGRS